MAIYWNIWSIKRGPFVCKKEMRNTILEDEFLFLCAASYYIRKALCAASYYIRKALLVVFYVLLVTTLERHCALLVTTLERHCL